MWNSNTNPKRTHDGALVAGQMLGRYELLSPIATGGMGNVWAARLKGTRGFRKLVAIKTILQSFEDSKLEQMLSQEGTLASQIHHPNVVETLELGEDGGILYLVMELIHGESLGCLMRESVRAGGLPLHVSVNLVAQVLRGLAAAHDLRDGEGNPIGLVHRDISPPNILVTYSGTVKIVDFGVATTSASVTLGTGEIKGKISYLAPEQLRGEPIDGRVDVFAAGVVLYLLTVGRHPFKGPTEAQTIARILGDTRPTAPSSWVPGYPEALETVVLQALEKDPNRRYRTANEFLAELHRAVPEAFGPKSEIAVADCVGELLNDRMHERRHSLREAEESTERTSSPTASSMTVMVASTPHPVSKPPSRVVFTVAGMLVALGLVAGVRSVPRARALLAGQAVAEKDAGSRAPVAAAPLLARPEGKAEPPAAPALRVQSALPPAGGPSLTTMVQAVATPGSAPAPVPAPVPAHAARRSSRVKGATSSADEPDPVALIDSALDGLEQGAPSSEEPILAEPAPFAGVDDGSKAPVPSFIAAIMVPRVAEAPKPAGPRHVPSKVGHGRLAINPQSDAYRVKLPPALTDMGQRFTATVRICVSPEGSVTGVNILRSAGPGIDALIPAALGRWRYQPLLENGEKLPFCYTLVYEVAGR